ncbi:hypothetical protein WMF20_28195 [Sorangium sp. So ce834]|uniref:hypothetical protein n=1 Tax=Sorangium sp. So ce834 TaxID=3133321 RepID=UPI003F5EFA5D
MTTQHSRLHEVDARAELRAHGRDVRREPSLVICGITSSLARTSAMKASVVSWPRRPTRHAITRLDNVSNGTAERESRRPLRSAKRSRLSADGRGCAQGPLRGELTASQRARSARTGERPIMSAGTRRRKVAPVGRLRDIIAATLPALDGLTQVNRGVSLLFLFDDESHGQKNGSPSRALGSNLSSFRLVHDWTGSINESLTKTNHGGRRR